jgi:hypothetical protein
LAVTRVDRLLGEGGPDARGGDVMRRVVLFLLFALMLFPLLSTPAHAQEPAGVDVTPSTGLASGDVVHVAATGLPPGVTVELMQCDVFFDNVDQDCFPTTFVTIADDGMLSQDVTLSDPVYQNREFGDPQPVYCRADTCHIFVVWNRSPETGGTQVLSSDALEFTGSPATLTVSPSTDLKKKQKVQVVGTAFGAEGQAVQVFEEACFSIVQGSGCYGASLLGSTVVAADGTWTIGRVRVTRFLADGTDCTDPGILGACEVSASILDATGTPDDSFGVSLRGQPAVFLTFQPGK